MNFSFSRQYHPRTRASLESRKGHRERGGAGGTERGPPSRPTHNAQLTWAGRPVVIKPKSFASAATAITHSRLSEIWPPFKLLCLEIHLGTPSPARPWPPFGSVSRRGESHPDPSPRSSSRRQSPHLSAASSGDVSQSRRFRNASVIYYACPWGLAAPFWGLAALDSATLKGYVMLLDLVLATHGTPSSRNLPVPFLLLLLLIPRVISWPKFHAGPDKKKSLARVVTSARSSRLEVLLNAEVGCRTRAAAQADPVVLTRFVRGAEGSVKSCQRIIIPRNSLCSATCSAAFINYRRCARRIRAHQLLYLRYVARAHVTPVWKVMVQECV